MKKLTFFPISIFALLLLVSQSWKTGGAGITNEMTVAEVLDKLGDESSPHLPRTDVKGVSAERGREIVLEGRTYSPYGGKSERVSKHFVCTSCHNVERDEPDLSMSDPEGRLEYVSEKGLPFLQGSALYGIVDRRSFYNDDYEKKYGGLVKAARNDLRESIHLCATECAQGRPLEDWEMESVLSYLWTIGLKMEDLNLSADEIEQINAAAKSNTETGTAEAIKLLKSKYLLGFPATFLDPPADRRRGAVETGNAERGKLIYELSCLHCHEQKRYSFFNLDNSKQTFDYLDKHIPTYSRYSIYQVVRYGTPPVPWKRAYMPHYTQEKMSVQMLEDLRTYIEQMAK